MKRRIINTIVALMAMATAGNAQQLSVSEVKAEAGAQSEITVNLTGATDKTALQYNLSLPAGLALAENAGDYGIKLGTATKDHTLSVNPLASGDLLIVLYSMNQDTFADGTLMTIPVVASSEAGTTSGSLNTIRTATADAVSSKCTDVAFSATVSAQSGNMPEIPANAIYFWEGAKDNATEKGGVATGHGASDGRVNYPQADYYTLSVNGKKANIETDYILITLDNALEATDEIAITAFRNKDTDANGTLYMLFENGFVIDEGDNVVWNNVNEAIGQQPNTNTYKVAEGAGSKTIKLTRSKSSTNVFISKFIITRGGTDGIQNVEVVTPANNVIYNLSGQKVDASYKGIIIVNGKKVVVGNR